MNELNVLKRICRHLFLAVLLCAVSAATASAQVPTVTVDAKNVTIKELLQRIEANSQYTFAYIDADINPDKRVSVKAVNRNRFWIRSTVQSSPETMRQHQSALWQSLTELQMSAL